MYLANFHWRLGEREGAAAAKVSPQGSQAAASESL